MLKKDEQKNVCLWDDKYIIMITVTGFASI